MKSIFFFFLCLFSLSSLACNQSIDSSRVILFVDANDSPREIASARTAACSRGENLVVVEPSEFDSRVRQLANSGTSITSLIASGHDGGGSFGGKNGDTSKREMLSSLNDAYADAGNTELLEDLHGLYLWGCYTTVPSEVDYWNAQLPNVKFIVGFQGSGPSNTNITGIRMLRSALESQANVLRSDTEARLQRALNGIHGINTTFSATFVDTCEKLNDQYYYTNTANSHGGLDRTLISYAETQACREKVREFQSGDPSMYSIVENYQYGITAIPQVTHGTDLRRIYSYLRQNDHCFSQILGDEVEYNANRVGLLLFYHGVKKNFPAAFSNLISSATREFNSVRSSLPAELSNVWMPTLNNIAAKSREEIIDNMANLSEVAIAVGDPSKTQNIRKLSRYMETYLNYMPDMCMDFLDWHEHIPGRVPRSRCSGEYLDYINGEYD